MLNFLIMLSTINFKKTNFFSCLLAVCFFSVGSLQSIYATNVNDNVKYTGEQLVRGILLLEGPAANAIPELRELTFTGELSASEALHNFNDKVINQIKRDQPSFIESFATRINSRQHQQIGAALEDGQAVVSAAIRKINSTAKMSPEAEAVAAEISQKMEAASSYADAAAIANKYVQNKYRSNQDAAARAADTAVAIAVESVAIAVAVEYYFRFWFWPEEISNIAQNDLYREQLIGSIAKNI